MDRNVIFHFDFELNHELLNVYGEKGRITLYKNAGEGMPHIAMKLLSYFWFYHPNLGIEKHANQNWKPDLVRFNDELEPVQWIDCGATKRHKLDRISVKNKKTYIDIVKKSPNELKVYKQMVEREISRPDRIRYWAPEPEFLQSLCESIFGRHKIIATVLGDREHIYLSIDENQLESSIYSL